jgi:hypothetical protein
MNSEDVETLRRELEEYKAGMRIWMTAAGDLCKQLQLCETVTNNQIKQADYWRNKYMEISGCQSVMPPTM